MTVESFLTRELDIRFIDARAIANEAKVNLKIQGYPTQYQEQRIRQEALRLFSKRPEASKVTMRQLSSRLETVKFPDGASDCESCDSLALSESTSSSTASRRVSIFRLGRR